MGALLGATLGVASALVVGNATTSGAVVASGPERAVVLAAGDNQRRHDNPGKGRDKAKGK